MKMNIDFDKYQRIFAFGCSFTQYGWPTWADLIASQFPDKKYYNYGQAGLGNLGIMSKITEANNRYQFNENDLVMVMWSTFCREDRWVKSGWLGLGNIFNSDYGDEWIKKYADSNGYLIRDHAIINLTNTFLKQSKFGSLILKSAPFLYTEDKEIDDKHLITDLTLLYANQYNEMPIDLYNYMGQNWGLCRQKFYEDLSDEPFMREDSHPFSTLYAEYLEHIGIQLTEEAKQLAIESDGILKFRAKKRSDIMKAFKYLQTMQARDKKHLF